jgi:hypothetical protein
MVAGIGVGQLSGVIHPYPTQGEAIRRVADRYQRTKLTPLAQRAIRTWLRWTR